jgi:hypothetical protein
MRPPAAEALPERSVCPQGRSSSGYPVRLDTSGDAAVNATALLAKSTSDRGRPKGSPRPAGQRSFSAAPPAAPPRCPGHRGLPRLRARRSVAHRRRGIGGHAARAEPGERLSPAPGRAEPHSVGSHAPADLRRAAGRGGQPGDVVGTVRVRPSEVGSDTALTQIAQRVRQAQPPEGPASGLAYRDPMCGLPRTRQ